MEKHAHRRIWPQWQSSAPSLIWQPRLLAVLAILALLVSFVIVISAVRTLAVMTMAAPPNPFPAFADVLPGATYRAVLARGFSCTPAGYNSATSNYYSYTCSLMPETGVFSLVIVSVYEGVVRVTSFTLREGTLRIGDLVRWWGRPEFHGNSHFTGFSWPGSGTRGRMIVSTVEHSLHYSLFLTVWRVAFVSGVEGG